MVGSYRSVAKQRAYLLRPVGSAAKEKTRFERWQISSQFARTKQPRDERGHVSRDGFNFHASRALSRTLSSSSDSTINRRPSPQCASTTTACHFRVTALQ